MNEVDAVAYYEKPFLKFERLLETYLSCAPSGFRSFGMAMPLWLKEKLFQKKLLGGKLSKLEPRFYWKGRLLFAEHHLRPPQLDALYAISTAATCAEDRCSLP